MEYLRFLGRERDVKKEFEKFGLKARETKPKLKTEKPEEKKEEAKEETLEEKAGLTVEEVKEENRAV